MALTQTWHCDRCSEPIAPGDRFTFKPVAGPIRHNPPLDLCSTCHGELAEWLGPGPLRSPEPTRPGRGRRPAADVQPAAV